MAKGITADDAREMDEQELVDFLAKECAENAEELWELEWQELVDLLVSHYPELSELHSDCLGGDFDPMHPNETLEDFLDHEDH